MKGFADLCSMVTLYFLLLCCLVKTISSVYTLKDVEIKADLGKSTKIFTDDVISIYDGSDENQPIYMGIKGVVFDVSSGKRFYGKDSPYNSLVGKDVTRAVAKMSLEEKDLTHDISDLSERELQSLDETFEMTYMAKYPIVGYMHYLMEQHPEKFVNVKTEL